MRSLTPGGRGQRWYIVKTRPASPDAAPAAGALPRASHPRHPAQLYEIAFLMLVLLPALVWLARRPHREGDLFKVFMVGYLGFRLGLEFLKPGDPIVGLTAIQWVCLASIAWYAKFLPGLVRLKSARTVLARG